MNYFKNEKFTDIDYVNMCVLYNQLLEKNVVLQEHIDNLERLIYVYKTVDKRYRYKLGAV